jgi:uncharacterized protein (TIGR02147 family)
LRSFAKALQVDPASLHRILTGKRAVTPRTLEKFAQKLQFSPAETEHFRCSNSFVQAPALKQIDFAQTENDVFEVISDWQHLAIMELLTLKDFQQDEKWVAERLGLSIHEARASVERLFRTGFLEIKDGRWVLCSRHNSFAKDGFTTVARQKLQKTFLAKASEAIDTLTMKDRDNSGVTIAIDKKQFPQFIEKINNFRREMAAFAEKSKKPNEVYQLTVAFFPLTKNKKEKSQ